MTPADIPADISVDAVTGGLLEEMLVGGYVRQQRHPELPLRIFNYTERAVYERVWNVATRTCRGLVVDADGVVRARPWPKMFNLGEPDASALDGSEPVVATDKLDGCFPRGTALNLWGGGTVKIEKVVSHRLPVTLVGMDADGKLVPAIVTDWHHNGRKDHWLDIEVDARVSRLSGAAGHPNRLRVTVNHHLAVNGEYRPAFQVQQGDVLTTQGWEPDKNVLRVIRASLLGDGCLLSSCTKPRQAKYQESHSIKQTEYVLALRKAIGNCAANRADTISGYGSRMVWAGSREYLALGDMREEWYPGGVKCVPSDLSWLNDFEVAKWLMDDGHRQHVPRQADRLAFSTHSFTADGIHRLGRRLSELYGISYHICADSGRGQILVINSGRRQETRRMWSAVAPHVHPSMRCEIPTEFRDVAYIEMVPGTERVIPVPATVKSVRQVAPTKRNFPHDRTGYDITTSTHNYFARGILVHNSLGIVFPAADGWAVATRGSFVSDQARHATAIWHRKYAAKFTPPPGVTVLVEIVFPGNRIVLDYGDRDELILLGGVEIATGRSVEVAGWPGAAAARFEYRTLADALAAPPRAGAEGMVLHVPRTDERVKLKQTDYVALHRLIFGLTARRVWERLAVAAAHSDNPEAPVKEIARMLKLAPADAAAILETGAAWWEEVRRTLPEEFHDWLDKTAADLRRQADTVRDAALARALELGGLPRRDAAAALTNDPDRGLVFAVLDGKPIVARTWAAVRPEHERPLLQRGEDVA